MAGTSFERAASKLAAIPLAAALALGSAPALLAASAPAAAQTASGQPYLAPGTTESLITDPTDKARYDKLAHELRCLVCQNQTLAESDASLAADLRRQVESMIVEGRTDAQIKSYLVERYGDFVLYRPPVQSNTWALWFGPFALLAIGVAVWIGINRRRRLANADAPGRPAPVEGAGAATSADIDRVRRLLDER
ncbi:cytochrome c-type biogenesis protein [Zeimonas arvi]|uniref:Cytochrome c-type biogenesis protein n=1 Tax=Zeimonas arvi TaxID=2498847 RepID=A0A5C8P4X0_9BURK|nr:cytochrome c-type biogenesis protein [Zeimonas arvi]TXL68184.1 cytochrome c-type biogenesis protein CcmH [Zeimonas arvi]